MFLLVTIIVLSCTSCSIFDNNMQTVKNEAYNYFRKLFNYVNVENVSFSNNIYCVSCTVSSSGKYFDMSAEAVLKYKKDNNGKILLVDNITYQNCKYNFHTVDEYYHYGRLFGNDSMVFKIQSMSETSITIQYYSHDLVSGGDMYNVRDSYSNGTDVWHMESLSDYRGFMFYIFDVGIPFHVYPNYIEYADETSGSIFTGYSRFIKLTSVNPDDYWWFDEAAKSKNRDE